MKKLGLIGFPLSHSFSKKYFTNKFKEEGIEGYEYDLYPIDAIELLPQLLKDNPELVGINVTIPYKKQVIPYLDAIHEEAYAIGAVNTIKIEDGKLTGYNTDAYGFEQSLIDLLNENGEENPLPVDQALVLGTGGAAKAILFILEKLNIRPFLVSRSAEKGDFTYNEIDENILNKAKLIINTTPLGMSPKIESFPNIPYDKLTPKHFLYDLVYNPEKTVFLNRGEDQKTKTKNGLEMLILQAEKSWDIWGQDDKIIHD